jgi:hypothetical protein
LRLSIAIGAGLVLSACGASAGSARPSVGSNGSVPPCTQAGSKTLAANGSVRVFSQGAFVYGCSQRTGRRSRLGRSTLCIGAERVGPVAVAGDDAAYGLERCGVDTGFTQVVVKRLTDGRELRNDAAITGPLGVESYEAVASLVVKGDGSVAWIASGRSIVGKGPSPVEVHQHDAHRLALLDSGPGIVQASLRLHGSKLTWKHGAAVRSATLD